MLSELAEKLVRELRLCEGGGKRPSSSAWSTSRVSQAGPMDRIRSSSVARAPIGLAMTVEGGLTLKLSCGRSRNMRLTNLLV
jgi:hypothetical protein